MPEDEYVERFGNMTLNYLRSTFERTQKTMLDISAESKPEMFLPPSN
jgi:hypothetical protein